MLTIYGVPVSVHTRKVIVTAILKGIAHHVEPVVPFEAPENWRNLSPTGLIPAISHDGFELADSGAICAYLERIAPEPSIYPAGAQAYGRALWLEQYAATVLFRQIVHPLFFQKVIRPHILNQGAADDAEIDRITATVVPPAFDYLESGITDGFLVYNGPTIADITIAANLLNYHYLGFRIDRERWPRLKAAFAGLLRERPFRAALDAEQPFAAQLGLDRSFLDETAHTTDRPRAPGK